MRNASIANTGRKWKWVHRCSSFLDLVEQAGRPQSKRPDSRDGDSNRNPDAGRASRRNEGSFNWNESFEDSVRHARNGWTEGAKHVKTATIPVSNVLSTSGSLRRNLDRVMCGGQPVMPRLMNGIPKAFVTLRKSDAMRGGSKIMFLAFNASAAGHIQHKTFRNRGAAAMALIDALESAGYRVYVELIHTVSNNSIMRCPLKLASQPLSETTHAYALAHCNALRRLVWGMEETYPWEVRREFGFTPSGGYGSPCNISKEDWKATFPGDIVPDYIFPALQGSGDFGTPEATLRTTVKMFEELTGAKL